LRTVYCSTAPQALEAASLPRYPCIVCSSPNSGAIADMAASTLGAITGREQVQQTTYTNAPLFDDLVGTQQERFGNFQSKRLGSCQIDDEIELRRLLDGKIGGLRPAQNFVDILGGSPEQVCVVWSIGHQTAHFDIRPRTVHRRQSRGECQRVN